MAGVAVLQPQDVLKQRVNYRQSHAKPMRSRRNPSSNPQPNPKNNRRKRSPQKNGSSNSSTSPPPPPPPPAKNLNLVMGEVKILKRGQVLVNKENKNKLVSEDLVLLSTTDRIGPEPDMVSKQITTLADFYAGSAFVSSPPPSSLPVPAFFEKKSEDNHNATSDLCRLLRLDLS